MTKKTKKEVPDIKTSGQAVVELQKEVNALRKSGDEMGEVILGLKRSIASYKSANTVLRRKLDREKAYGKEADELLDMKVTKIDELQTLLTAKQQEITQLENKVAVQTGIAESKANIIEGLETQVREMSESLKTQANRIETLKSDAAVAQANLNNYKSLPWYRKIFSR